MKAAYDDRQRAHSPRMYMNDGVRSPCPEQPARIDALRTGADDAGCDFQTPSDYGVGPIAAVHSAEYLVFLQNVHARRRQIPNASDEVIPKIHPDRRTASYPQWACQA